MRATFVFVTAIIFSCMPAFAQAPQIQWLKCFGGTSTESCIGLDKTGDGYILAGYTGSSDGDITNFHGGFSDVWVIKVDIGGNLQWQKCLGGSDVDQAYSIQHTSDGGYIIGGYSISNDGDVSGGHGSDDCWIVKLDASGSMQWQKCFGGTYIDVTSAIRQTTDGGYIVCGRTASSDGDVSYLHGDNDCWLVKIDGSGNLQWEKTYGGTGYDVGVRVIQSSDGGYVVAATTNSNDGDVTVSYGSYDAWIFKIDSIGNLLWQKSYGGSQADNGYVISETPDGKFIVAAYTASDDGDVTMNHGGYDAWLLKLDTTGSLLWQQTYGGTDDEQIFAIQNAAYGGYIFGGYSHSTDGDVTVNHGGNDAWIVRIADDGTLLWQKSIGGGSQERAYNIVQDTDGAVVFGGFTISNDGDISGSHGAQDLLLTKFNVETLNIVTGKIFIDLNSNNMQDAGEHVVTYHRVDETVDGNSFFSGNNGIYHAICDTGNYIVSAEPLNNFSCVPIFYSGNFPSIHLTDSLKDFAFQPDIVCNDLQISITPASSPRVGKNVIYFLNYRNVGTTVMNATVVFNWDAAIASYISADVSPASIGNDSSAWIFNQLYPYEEGTIQVTLRIDTGVVVGTLFNAGCYIDPVQGDAFPFDNIGAFEAAAVLSHDPNDKVVDHVELSNTDVAAGTTLDYVIRFQNIGTDTAFTVFIQDTMSPLLDMSTFQLLSTSHPVEITYYGANRLLKFQFNNILLPDSGTDEPASHGFVHYRIKPYTWLMAGNVISNEASIYFDLNAPVITNEAQTVIMDPLSFSSLDHKGDWVMLTPNPTTSEVSLHFTDNNLHEATLFNFQGNILLHVSGGEKLKIDLGEFARGIYFISVKDIKNNLVVKKIVKL